MNIIVNKIFLIMLQKHRTVMAIALVLFIAGTAIAQDVFNNVNGNDEVKKTTVTAPPVKKQPVVQSRDNKGSDALVTALKNDKDRQVRRSAAKALAAMKSKNQTVIKTFIRHLNDADPTVRKEAADGLKKIGTPAIHQLTVALKKHKNPVVRRQAAILIGEISQTKQHSSAAHKNTQKSTANGNLTGKVVKVNKPAKNIN